ncbi:MAG: catalase family peroxidase [Acidimicrobiales bacterium]
MSIEQLAVTIVDELQANAGPHPAGRIAHAKGICARGTFTASGVAAELTRAAHLRGGSVPAVVRFSNGGANRSAADGTRDGRGMAARLYLDENRGHDLVAVSLPVFFARTPEDFLEFVRARRPDPATGQPDIARVMEFLASHPESVPAVQSSMAALPPVSYATVQYHGIHTFVLVDGDARRTPFRYQWEPHAGTAALTDAEAAERPRDYLHAELSDRLAREPVQFRLTLQLAEPDDPLDDPTAAWPADRPTISAGHLELTSLVDDQHGDCEARIFDPGNLVDGVEPSGDPILAIRSYAYGVSYARRHTGS